jgi:hypothetical protein
MYHANCVCCVSGKAWLGRAASLHFTLEGGTCAAHFDPASRFVLSGQVGSVEPRPTSDI